MNSRATAHGGYMVWQTSPSPVNKVRFAPRAFFMFVCPSVVIYSHLLHCWGRRPYTMPSQSLITVFQCLVTRIFDSSQAGSVFTASFYDFDGSVRIRIRIICLVGLGRRAWGCCSARRTAPVSQNQAGLKLKFPESLRVLHLIDPSQNRLHSRWGTKDMTDVQTITPRGPLPVKRNHSSQLSDYISTLKNPLLLLLARPSTKLVVTNYKP